MVGFLRAMILNADNVELCVSRVLDKICILL